MEIINAYGSWLVLITAVFGFFMAFGIGANDVSNSMGTSVGSGTITAKQAIIIALIFESAGAYLAGGEVTETIKSGVIDPTQFVEMPDVLALGMLSALFASGAWLFIATKMGWPVSGTHTIIGALIGFACITIGPSSVDWSTIGGIVGSWFITPVIAGLLAYIIFASIQKLIFDTEEPLKNAQKYGPYYMAITVFVLCIVTMAKGLGGGLPIGGVLAAKSCADVMGPGTHGSTFGGNPVSAASANEVLDTVMKPEFLKEVEEKGAYIKEKVLGFHSQAVKNVRGMGLMLGIIVDPEKRAGYVAKLMEKGVLVLTAGTDAIRLLPPLVITYEEIDQALEAMKGVFES